MIFKDYRFILFFGVLLLIIPMGNLNCASMTPLSSIENPKIVEIPSSYRDEVIWLEYQIDKGRSTNRKMGIRYEEGTTQNYKILEGNSDLPKIIQLGIWSTPDPDESSSPVLFDFDSELSRTRLDIFLKYPVKESPQKLLQLLSGEIGFQYDIQKNRVEGYKATWNGKNFSFSTTTKTSSLKRMNVFQINNLSLEDIFQIYSEKYNVTIVNETENKERYSGYIFLPSRLDDVMEDLYENCGIKMNPITITVEKYILKPK